VTPQASETEAVSLTLPALHWLGCELSHPAAMPLGTYCAVLLWKQTQQASCTHTGGAHLLQERGEVAWPSEAAQGTGQAAGSAATLPASSKPAQAADGGSRVTVAPVPSEPMPPGTPDSRQPAEAAPQAEHPVLPTVRVADRAGSDISVTG
jgi:hypothetical protein